MNNTEPLPFYKEPLYYTGLVALIGIGLVIYSIVRNNVSSNLMVPFVVVAFIFGAATYFMWDTRCPHCKRPFSKKEQIEWKEEKGQWLGEAPKPQYIKKKGSSMNLGFDDEKESNRKIRVPIKKSVQRELFNRADNACQLCGTNKRQLHIHHIDKNPSNNSKNNLIVVCAGCHSIAESLTKIQLQNSAQKPYRKSKTINIYK